MKKTFIFYNDRQDYTEHMSLEEKGLFLQVILDYQNGKETGDLGVIKFIRSRVKKQLDKDNESWDDTIEKRRLAGIEGNKKRRGDGNGSQTIANATKGSQMRQNDRKISQMIAVNVNDNVNVNENKNDIIKEETEKTTAVVPGSKPKSIINKQNKPGAIQIYDKIKEICTVVDGNLSDCVILHSKLKLYGGSPPENLGIIIQKMKDIGLNKFYSISSPGKLADNLGTIVEKIKAESSKTKQFSGKGVI